MRRVLGSLALLVMLLAAAPLSAGDLAKYSLCDVRVLYIYDDPQTIDWPSLYYLNDDYGCRIDLLRAAPHTTFQHRLREIPDREIYAHEVYLNLTDSLAFKNLADNLFAQRRPDIVILGDVAGLESHRGLIRFLSDLPPQPGTPFNIAKIYARSWERHDTLTVTSWVNLSSRELATRYRKRMDVEVPLLFDGYRTEELAADRLARYRLLNRPADPLRPDVDFLTGIETIRMISLLDAALPEGTMRRTYVRYANHFIEQFRAAPISADARRVDLLSEGYRHLLNLDRPLRVDAGYDPLASQRDYFRDRLDLAERAMLEAIGLQWDSRIDLRDTPHGPRIKLTVAFSVEGPREVTVDRVEFHPFPDSAAVPLDTVPRAVGPHQSLVREYLVEVEPDYLETQRPESLLFSVTLTSGRTPVVMHEARRLWEIPGLDVAFEPPFHFVPPVARLEVDRIISSMAWNVIINKPPSYSGRVRIDLETPRGVFAGAYRQEIDLISGNTRDVVRIPFSVSQLFELGTQDAVVKLSVGSQVVAADTGIIRIAACNIGDTIAIGFLPDTSGALEDILRMTDATHRPLTERTLQIGDLAAYDVIVIGSGALRNYPSFREVRDRLEEFVRWGGSLVVFGQDNDWPESTLPFALVPSPESVGRNDLKLAIAQPRLFGVVYSIDVNGLLSYFDTRRRVAAGVLTPSESVLQTSSGASLLAVARLGQGQVIFCGLPLMEMIGELNLEAIHLFANLMNY